ncbi:MAG: response regulator [Alphaproteobacteria bacterium]|nr:response regulator [Alphaproteobacteria bacterium]
MEISARSEQLAIANAKPHMPHLLLVDDDDLFRESLSLNLIDEGYEVTGFDNGRDVLAYLSSGSADVMLLDWRMPDLSGIDVLQQMRGSGIRIPVIFLTALSDDIYEEAALERGAVDFIDKSRRLPILLKRLQLIAGRGGTACRA